MEKYISRKPCKFGDRQFIIGEEVPVDLIDPSRVNVLKKYGVIETIEVLDAPAPVQPDQQVQPDLPGNSDDPQQPVGDNQDDPDQQVQPAAAKKGGKKVQG